MTRRKRIVSIILHEISTWWHTKKINCHAHAKQMSHRNRHRQHSASSIGTGTYTHTHIQEGNTEKSRPDLIWFTHRALEMIDGPSRNSHHTVCLRWALDAVMKVVECVDMHRMSTEDAQLLDTATHISTQTHTYKNEDFFNNNKKNEEKKKYRKSRRSGEKR